MVVMELIKQLEKDSTWGSSSDSFGEYTKNYMLDGECFYQRYVQGEEKSLSPFYMKEYRKLYEKHITTDQIICSKKVSEITRVDLIRFRERIVAKLGASSVARKVFKILKQNLNYATIMGDISFNPSVGMSDIKEKKRKRGILTMDEIKKIDFTKKALFIDEAYHSIDLAMGATKKGVKLWCPIPERTLEYLKLWLEKTRFGNINIGAVPKYPNYFMKPFSKQLLSPCR